MSGLLLKILLLFWFLAILVIGHAGLERSGWLETRD